MSEHFIYLHFHGIYCHWRNTCYGFWQGESCSWWPSLSGLAQDPSVTRGLWKVGKKPCVCCHKPEFKTHLSGFPVLMFGATCFYSFHCREADMVVLKYLLFHPTCLTLLNRTRILFIFLSIVFMTRWFMGGDSFLRTRDIFCLNQGFLNLSCIKVTWKSC